MEHSSGEYVLHYIFRQQKKGETRFQKIFVSHPMSLTILTGKISHVDHSTATTGGTTARGNLRIQTRHVWSFRLNNHPVTYTGLSTGSFGVGDELTAAGQERNGTFVIESCRNETTGAVYERPATLFCVPGLIIAISLPLMLVLVGFLILPFGIYFFMKGLKYAKANKLLQAAPRPAQVPSVS
jgi:hypothetical protein